MLIIENNAYDEDIATDSVKLLIRVGYFFNSHLAVKIYQKINQYVGVTLSPTYIEKALNSFAQKTTRLF